MRKASSANKVKKARNIEQKQYRKGRMRAKPKRTNKIRLHQMDSQKESIKPKLDLPKKEKSQNPVPEGSVVSQSRRSIKTRLSISQQSLGYKPKRVKKVKSITMSMNTNKLFERLNYNYYDAPDFPAAPNRQLGYKSKLGKLQTIATMIHSDSK